MASMSSATPSPILKTKLAIPPVRSELVLRPRLTESLRQGLERKLTLLAAPAGYGKTTALAHWISRHSLTAAWLSLDDGDNDPARFLAHIVAALRDVGLETSVEGLEAPGTPAARSMEPLLSQLINDVDAAQEPFLLVLDDYHLIKAESIHESLVFLLEHMPASMHLAIATRADPPLPLARLRAQAQLVELRAAELRFTDEEAAQFLTRVSGRKLRAQDLKTLARKTEGWIAGLQLAAISLRESDDPQAFVEAFSGSHEYIVDYLTDEVLKGRPEELRQFLLRTSILDRLTGTLCDAVAGQSGGQATLEALAEANLFVLPLDNRRQWYRYHTLFKDVLQQRLYQSQPESIPDLHRRASEWYESNALHSMAIDHAVQAEDFDQAVSILERIAEETLIRTEFVLFLRWIEAIPDEWVRARPKLCIFYASALLFSGRDPETVRRLVDDAVEADPAVDVSGEAAVLYSALAMAAGDVKTSIERSHDAFEKLPEDNLFMRSLVIGNLGVGYMSSGDVEAASAYFSKAADMGEQSGSYLSSVMAVRRLAEVNILKGDLHAAWKHCERGTRIATGRRGDLLPVGGIILGMQAALLREWNDLDAARERAESGLELELRWSELIAVEDYLVLARVRQSQGDDQGASESMRTAQQIAAGSTASRIAPLLVAIHQARLWIAQGDLAAAERWATGRVPLAALFEAQGYELASYHHLIELEGITMARLRVAQGLWEEALETLRPLLQSAEQLGRSGSAIEISALMALAHQGQGDIDRALGELGAALERAEPQGYVRTFVDEGEPMRRLLSAFLHPSGGGSPSDRLTIYVNKLLAALVAESASKERAPDRAAAALAEPLSERELEVLRLLATPLTSTQIAGELYISANTVRFHIKNIYGKLGVHRRADAVDSAREIGLI